MNPAGPVLLRAGTEARYFDIAEAAEQSMQAAITYSGNPPSRRCGNASRWLAELCRRDSGKILGMDNKSFAAIMRNWGNWMGNPLFYRANLCDQELRNITVPTLICPCSDDYHPERLAEDLRDRLPESTYIPSRGHRPHDEIYNADQDENAFGGFVEFVDAYEKYAVNLLRDPFS